MKKYLGYDKSQKFLEFCVVVSSNDYDLRYIRGMVALIIGDHYVKYEDGLFELYYHKTFKSVGKSVIKTFRIDTFAIRIIRYINNKFNYQYSLRKIVLKYTENLKRNNLILKEQEKINKVERETYQQKIKRMEMNKKQRDLHLKLRAKDLEIKKQKEELYQHNLELRRKEYERKKLRKELGKKYAIYEDIINPEIYGGFSDILLSNSSFLKKNNLLGGLYGD